jgi:two-component system chemotaxis sensor kinase CheA
MDTTRSGLLSQFREEVDTHLLRLSQGVVVLEQNPRDMPVLKDVFRAAHTIKGAAKMMGFADISRITHEMESVLAAMRDGDLLLTPDITDVLIEAIDAVEALTRAHVQPGGGEGPAPAEQEDLVARLHALVPSDGPAPGTGTGSPARNGQENGHAPAAPGQEITPALPAANGGGGTAPAGSFLEDTVRVQVQKLDTLMNLSGEMIISKMQNEAIADRLQAMLEASRALGRTLGALNDTINRGWDSLSQQDLETALSRMHELDQDLDQLTATTLREFQAYAGHVNNVADELEDTVLSVRMLPVESLFTAFPRAVRDMARDSGKQVELVTQGGDTELDKKILEALYEPLVHLLRNAVDHGIEPPAARVQAGKPPAGRVGIRAFQQGGQVGIEVSDDGAGIDPQVVRRTAVQKGFLPAATAEKLSDDEILPWIYHPGFTTAHIITDVSGRGVGMDIVKSTLEHLNGTVQVSSERGRGTTISLKVPLTLATTQGLLVRVANQVFVLPSHTVETMDYISADDLFMLEGQEAVRLRERTMPLVRLEELLDLGRVHGLHTRIDVGSAGSEWSSGISLAHKLPGIVVGESERQLCFLVDELIDERVIVVKSLGPLLANVPTQVGATMLGNGQVVIILDVPSLISEARARSTQGRLAPAWRTAAPVHRYRILVVDDSITTRELEKSILENAGYVVEIAMDGREALNRLEKEPSRFDMMIADIEMPHMDGLELTQRVKQHTDERLRQLPVIIVSSLASDAYKRRGIEVGAQAYITKGQFEQSRLLDTIELLIH